MPKKRQKNDDGGALLPFMGGLPSVSDATSSKKERKKKARAKKKYPKKPKRELLTVGREEVQISTPILPKVGAESLGLAQAELLDRIVAGTGCPCCGQFVKIYRRPLYSSQVYALVLVYRESKVQEQKYIYVPKLLNGKGVSARGGDFCKLAHWGFIEQMPGPRPDGSKRSGWWAITKKGEAFIEGASVPKAAFFFNGTVVGWSTDQVTLRDALGKNFDYAKLMGYAA